jgi:hypothetical protein
MEIEEQLLAKIISKFIECDTGFKEYWNKLDPEDKRCIKEDLMDTIYDWLEDKDEDSSV